MRLLRHPGPAAQQRILVEPSAAAAEFAVELEAGADLLGAFDDILAARGIEGAAIRFAGGILDRIGFVTGVPDATGYRIATHSAPTRTGGPVMLLAGSAIFGRVDPKTFRTHCHAVFVLPGGEVRSGHLLGGECPVAIPGARAFVTSTGTSHFQVAFDSETNFALFEPRRTP
ncbi:MAG: DUF296 domain-containing protein [Alphaproteobacteria bacterium]|nr:DUF296 domain-containing protein [Alphaproteobacteria bacterium]